MLYWLTETAGSSARMYYENMHAAGPGASTAPVSSASPRSPKMSPFAATVSKATTSRTGRDFDEGGHFAAMEVPDLLVADVRTFFRTVR